MYDNNYAEAMKVVEKEISYLKVNLRMQIECSQIYVAKIQRGSYKEMRFHGHQNRNLM